MKLIYTSIIVLMTTISYSQGIELYKIGETLDISGTEIIVTSSPNQSVVHQSFDLLNTTGNILNLRVVRVKLEEAIGGVQDELCWGADLLNGQCYVAASVSPQDPYTSEDSWQFPSILAIDALKSTYFPNGIEGVSKYRYYILDNDSAVKRDSVDVTFTTLLSTEEEVIDFSVYPNPANDILNISISENNTSISIFDIVGKNISTMTLVNGNNTMNIENLTSGVYFYSIKRNGDVIETKKLIVQ